MAKRIGSRTIELTEDVRVAASAAVAGKKEGEGPLKDCFDYVSQDSYFAEDSWEKAETSMLRQCFGICRIPLHPMAKGDMIFFRQLLLCVHNPPVM